MLITNTNNTGDKLILIDITIEVSGESSMEVIKKLTLIKN